MKKIKLLNLLLLSSSCLSLTGCFTIISRIINKGEKEEKYELTKQSAKLYASEYYSLPITTYSVNNREDITYVDFKIFFNNVFVSIAAQTVQQQSDYTLKSGKDGSSYKYTNKYGYFTIDAKKDTIYISDAAANLFLFGYQNGHQIIATGLDTNYVEISNDHIYHDREPVTLNLGKYNIDIIEYEEKIYIPINTFVDCFFNSSSVSIVFNGKDLYVRNSFGDDMYGGTNLTALENKFYSESPWNKKSKRSESLANFTYNEMCFALDTFYGLKEKRNVSSFDSLFNSLGVAKDLKSTNPDTYEKALLKFSSEWLFEGHSGFSKISPFRQGANYNSIIETGYAKNEYYTRLMGSLNELTAQRNEHSKNVGLYVYGNTAIIRFDTFMKQANDFDYQSYSYSTLHSYDTYYFFRKAFYDIENYYTGISKVVFDITLNVGGMLDAMPWLIAFMTSNPTVTCKNTLNKEVNTIDYRIDLNKDGLFGTSQDTYQGKYQFYVMSSRLSFSCGNYFPTIIKDKGLAKIIGEKSGGGSCAVAAFTTACGDMFNLSSSYQLGTVNSSGTFKDNEDGVPVDYSFNRSNFYDDFAIYSFVNSI